MTMLRTLFRRLFGRRKKQKKNDASIYPMF
jgi:hypothetical protein